MGIKDKLEDNIVWWSLIMVVVGFAAGFGAYKTILQVTNQTTLSKGTFISIDDLNRDYIKKTDCGAPDLENRAALEMKHRAQEALKALKFIEGDLQHERYDPKWIYTLAVDLLNGNNKDFPKASLNAYPEFRNNDFADLIRTFQSSSPSKKPEANRIQAGYDGLKEYAASAPYQASKDQSSQALKEASRLVKLIEEDLKS
jgi:hypothetical protein